MAMYHTLTGYYYCVVPCIPKHIDTAAAHVMDPVHPPALDGMCNRLTTTRLTANFLSRQYFQQRPRTPPPGTGTSFTDRLSVPVDAPSATLHATMGRRPNALILQYFERGPKLQDQSNRYPHTCKA